MSGVVLLLMIILAVWMTACAYYGYKTLFLRFLIVLFLGLVANAFWMIMGLNASLTEPHAMVALASAGIYGFCAFGSGLLVGRLVRQWRASAVDSRGV